MVILAIDTSSRPGSMAVWDEGVVVARGGSDARAHGERLPGDAVDLLASTGHRLADVEVFAVVSGPGSFTGLRIGMATVQGWALAGGRRAIGIPTLDAVVAAWLVEAAPLAASALVVPCVDGQRGDLFYAAYRAARGAARFEDLEPVLSASVGPPEEMAAATRALAGPVSCLMVGEAAARLHPNGLEPAGRPARLPRLADAAARLAAARQAAAGPPHALRPIYVRRPDAVLARERAATHGRR